MNEIAIRWIFTIGTFFGYLAMLLHSFFINPKNKTYFIFVGEAIVAYILEFILVNILKYYSYTGLPIQLFAVPLIIPLGWILTFYGIYYTVQDFLINRKNTVRSQMQLILYSGIVAFFFGFSIEILAKLTKLWNFNFNQFNIIGIPISVPFAWAFTIMTYVFGLVWFEKKPKLNFLILIIILLLNIIIAILIMLIF